MSLRSMTGFGSATAPTECGGSVSVTARSVNHRFLDIAFRLPPELKGLEGDLRALVKTNLERGRVEVGVELNQDEGLKGARLDLAAARDLSGFAAELQAAGLVEGQLRPIDVLRFPGVLHSDGESAVGPPLVASIRRGLENALGALVSARSVEGQGLKVNLQEIIAALGVCQATAAELSEANRVAAVERYRERLTSLLDPVVNPAVTVESGSGGPSQLIDQNRVLQEAGVLVERIDIAEEVERLGVHLQTATSVVEAGGPCGKRLDFLAQELLREINTMASKCRDSRLSMLTVDAKVLCERFREQVQNVE